LHSPLAQSEFGPTGSHASPAAADPMMPAWAKQGGAEELNFGTRSALLTSDVQRADEAQHRPSAAHCRRWRRAWALIVVHRSLRSVQTVRFWGCNSKNRPVPDLISTPLARLYLGTHVLFRRAGGSVAAPGFVVLPRPPGPVSRAFARGWAGSRYRAGKPTGGAVFNKGMINPSSLGGTWSNPLVAREAAVLHVAAAHVGLRGESFLIKSTRSAC
jgi:hypothetical protein